jgi:hypothetical protein
MFNVYRIGRLGIVAVGLGVSAAVASTPWIASADPVAAQTAADAAVGSAAALTDPVAFDPNNFAVSIDGITLIQEGSAIATSTFGGIAIADGADSLASADGFLDIATAEGVESNALDKDGILQVADAYGDKDFASSTYGLLDAAFTNGGPGGEAFAGGENSSSLGYFDAAFANGAGSEASAGLTSSSLLNTFDLASASDGLTAIADSGPFDAVFNPPL